MSITKAILEELYCVKDFKSSEVAKTLGVSISTVLNYLHKYGIAIKGIGHYSTLKEIQFNSEQFEFFDGLMLSDGSLTRKIVSYGNGLSNAKISCAFKYEEFAKYINNFLGLNGNIHKKIHRSIRYKIGQCIQYGLFSSDNIFFTKERNRWYPNGKKEIPEDFRFSPISMNIAYLGDGHLIGEKGGIILSTQSFARDKTEAILIKSLSNIDIKCWITKSNEIRISRLSTIDFLSFIGNCPVECYKYKWNCNR
jgi:hypothetical protein